MLCVISPVIHHHLIIKGFIWLHLVLEREETQCADGSIQLWATIARTWWLLTEFGFFAQLICRPPKLFVQYKFCADVATLASFDPTWHDLVYRNMSWQEALSYQPSAKSLLPCWVVLVFQFQREAGPACSSPALAWTPLSAVWPRPQVPVSRSDLSSWLCTAESDLPASFAEPL